MNKTTFRMKGSKKAVTPVIATIILIAGTLVLALVVGAYTFGLFGSNVKTVTLTSATLYAGTSTAITSGTCPASGGYPTLVVSLSNPGSTTTVTSLTLSGAGVTVAATNAFAGSSCTAITTTAPSVTGASASGSSTTITFEFGSTTLVSGNQYNYVISLGNGQSIQGVLTAQ